jgi:hypothetical protein
MQKFNYKIRYEVQSQYADEIEYSPYREEPNKSDRKYYKNITEKSFVLLSEKEMFEEDIIDEVIEMHSDQFRAGYTTDQLILDSIKILKDSPAVRD